MRPKSLALVVAPAAAMIFALGSGSGAQATQELSTDRVNGLVTTASVPDRDLATEYRAVRALAESEPPPATLTQPTTRFVCLVHAYPPRLDAENRINAYADHTCESRPDWAPEWLEVRLLSRSCSTFSDRAVTGWVRSPARENNTRVSRATAVKSCAKQSPGRWYVTEARAYAQNGAYQTGGKSEAVRLACSN
ncbi:hypothetical protein AB0G79_02140 [Streptomyces sp. NPDC020807]|uniref:hypothetical protein n=1 Tax=Streptomyces sp. NPDC020807 TaxID=3155119 RepID=UPI0033F83E37